MQVRFSADIFRVQRYGGVSRYFTEVHRGLLRLGVDSQIDAGLHRCELLRDVRHVRGMDVERLRPVRARQALTRVVDAGLSRLEAGILPRGSVWHPSYFTAVRPRSSIFAVTVFDMIHERFPEEVSPRDITSRVKRPACLAADVLFAISSDTKADLVDRYAVDPDRVVVTPLGVTAVVPRERQPPFGGRRYLLYVGDRGPSYKNWPTLLQAVAAAGADTRLACFGAPPSPAEHAMIAVLGLEGRVTFGAGDDRDLAAWYAGAAALVYPSRYEGFGLPPLEAMAHGCAVVATRVGAIPETVGDAALLVDPDVDSLTDGIRQVLAGGATIDRLSAAGRARVARYSWETTAAATLAGYQGAHDGA